MIGGESIDASTVSIGLSKDDSEQIVFRVIWKPLKKSMGPLARQQLENLKKYHSLCQGDPGLKLEDVEWSDLGKLDEEYENYQLLLLDHDGLYRIKFDVFNGNQGRLSQVIVFFRRTVHLSMNICVSLSSHFSFR